MKNNRIVVLSKLKRTIKITKLAVLMLTICLSQVVASVYAQTVKLNVSAKNETLESVLKQIEKQSEFLFFYNLEEVNKNEKISITKKNADIQEVLDAIVTPIGLKYTIKNRHIVLTQKALKASSISQRSQKVTGVISDAMGSIVGVSVVQKGTTNGTVTDIDGKYSIDVPSNATLEFSFVGYISQDIVVKEQSVINVLLKEDTQALDEVVVVGYGTQKKANLSGSVSSISAEQIVNRPTTTISAALQGTVPGMTISTREGRPGGDGGTIRIRGVGTLNNSNPYILVDGIESSMDLLDPNEISSISVLKDASSAAIYGSKAANGVILITTKRGQQGKPVVNYSGIFGWAAPTALMDRLESGEYARLYNEALDNAGQKMRFTDEDIRKFEDGSDPYGHPNTNWRDLLYTGSGFQHQHNVSASGGTNTVRYMGTIGYIGQEGIIPNSYKKQFNVRTNLDIDLTSRMQASFNLSYINKNTADPTNSFQGGGSDQIFRQVNRIAPWIPYKNEDGTYGTISDGNPIAWLDLDQTQDKQQDYFTGIATLKYKIIDGLTFSATGSYKMDNVESSEFIKDIQYNSTLYHGPNKLNQSNFRRSTTNGDLLLDYKKSFNNTHNLSVLAGYHAELFKYKEASVHRQNFPNNEVTDVNAGSTSGWKNSGYTRELAMLSYFARVNYDYKGKYLLEGNVRADASSRFAKEHRWGYFPSFSAAWRISEESFMKDIEMLDNLKVRASLGWLGNQDALDDYYPYLPTYSLSYKYPFADGVQQGIAQGNAVNAAIEWEKARTWGIGVDIALLKSLNFTIDYYDRRTSGILMRVEAPSTFGMSGYMDNIGELSNKGIEVSAQYTKRFRDITFNASLNFAYNKNEILNLGNVDRIISGSTIKQVGDAVNSFYVYKTDGIFKSQEEINAYMAKVTYKNTGKTVMPGDIRYVDVKINDLIDGDDRIVQNSSDPKYTFGGNIGAQWKYFDINLTLQGVAGVSAYMEREAYGEFDGDTSHPSTYWRDRFHPVNNPNGTVPRLGTTGTSPSDPSSIYSDFWLVNANYLRLKNLQFGFTLPSNWLTAIGVSKARIYYSGQNLFTISNMVKGIDPEAPSGRNSQYPQVKVNSIGVNVTF